MSKRGVSHRAVCAHEGCGESAWYEFDTQREYREWIDRNRQRPWKCTRHFKPAEVLSKDAPERTEVLVSTNINSPTGRPLGLFWVPEGGVSGSGFTHGPGFKAYTSDFPEGTRLIVTARIEVPS